MNVVGVQADRVEKVFLSDTLEASYPNNVQLKNFVQSSIKTLDDLKQCAHFTDEQLMVKFKLENDIQADRKSVV